ncbi:alpha-ketoglutarate decarboxylase [Aurantibacter crassamenti]|uniref:alpha-ketoglutarate decarboxylase n=1 Tax=Aurantibacter crassamenti TaxID=1837375 RepID=UPI001939D8A9|nr:alpha-ketoglutarate decarboxylase [Aurantibacter crassamenti]MBM1105924.1 alpha-ketoglutarate decarboxylase [Aurantibacter crassamenti]
MQIVQFSCLKKIYVFFIIILVSTSCFAQNQSQSLSGTSTFWSHVRFGGGLGLGITNGGFNASVSPSAIYQFNEQFASGASATFNYAKYKEDKRTAYGGSILSLYNPVHFLQISAELEQLRVNQRFDLGTTIIEENYWSPALFIGLGYTSNLVTVGIRYDVLFDNNKSIYAGAWMPFVRIYL